MKNKKSKKLTKGGTATNPPVPIDYITPTAGFPFIQKKVQIVQLTSGIMNRFKNILF